MSSPLEFQVPLGSYNSTPPTAGPLGGLSPVDPSYNNPRRTSLMSEIRNVFTFHFNLVFYFPSLHSRNPLLPSDGTTPPSQSCNSAVSNPPDMSRWNPFGEDNFSKLTEEELIDREFDLLRASK
ncbi:hypothetical protein F2P81_014428 [Scophthalmus maximus]|uniref:Uncharacterized protein n=1 Tax=Scophthalmus maximus TaxID=52904 RepID=A0A6A4SWC0_SCOMX|nr:hypothetical protein F2P81_014428 [Scophthalmus maximus]